MFKYKSALVFGYYIQQHN